jgi:TRAP-type uncharacterized transport system substrate-binding protein
MAIWGAVLTLALAGCVVAAFVLFHSRAPRTQQIHMASDTTPRTMVLAKQIRAHATDYQLDIALTAKEYGTLEALEEVDSPSEVNFALVSGGVTARDYAHVRAVTTLTKEYLHLLVRRGLADKGFAGLRGKRIALGPQTTASYHVARDVLSFVGVPATADRNPQGAGIDALTPQAAHRELQRIGALEGPARAEAVARLPDAVLFLAPLPSPFAREMIANFGYELVPLPFAEAYGLDRLNAPGPDGIRVDRSLVSPGAIPAYTYGSNLAQPARECPTLCVPLILVAGDDADPEAVVALLKAIHESPLATALRPPPLEQQVWAFPRHAGTERYLHRNDPVMTPENAYRFSVVAGGIGAFLSSAIAFYSFLRLRSLRRFESYYHEIGWIELVARGLEHDPDAPADVASLHAYLERRLTALKCKVVEDFAAGGLRGEGLMAGIIALINDTRESLSAIVAERPAAAAAPPPPEPKKPETHRKSGRKKG